MSGTLRDQLESAVNEAEVAQESVPLIDKIDDATIAESTRVGEANAEKARSTVPDNPRTEESKPGRTAGRARDEQGKLLPGKAQREAAPVQALGQPQVAAPVVEAVPLLPRPSSWKKEMWPIWDKLSTGAALDAKEARQLAEYTGKRESDFASGVSTYKNEYDRVKPIADAITPFLPVIQQTGMKPEQWINELGQAHRVLATGTQAQKLEMFKQIAINNGIDLQAFGQQLFVRGQDGQLYLNQQFTQRPQAQQPAPQQDVRKVVQELFAEQTTNQAIAAFEAEAPTKYQHYETVKPAMIGLLQSGLAADLPSAYEAAIRLPQHSAIWNAMQEQQRVTDEAKKREEALKATNRARSNAISPRSAPSTGNGAGTGAKGLRGLLESAVDEHTTGRV